MSQMIDPNQVISIHPKTGRVHVETVNNEPTMTQQQFKEECDVNNIIKKFASTGEFLHKTSKQGAYSDFSQITDYQEMLHTVQYAQEAFSSLPAEVRKRFENNPNNLLSFLQDPNNRAEGEKLGLINPTPPQELSLNANQQTQTQNANPKSKKSSTPPPSDPE